MENILKSIDWLPLLRVLWTAVLLPLLTLIWKQLYEWTRARKLDKYADIAYHSILSAVKDVYETSVKDIKGTGDWTKEKQDEVHQIAREKALQALADTVSKTLNAANSDFDQWFNSLVGTALYDLKNK